MLMKATRRRFFALAGSAPIAAKVAADKAVADLTGVAHGGNGMSFGNPSGMLEVTNDQYRMAFLNPFTRGAIESLVYEQERCIGVLDVDLAACRSFSMAAKITFQRQRNVERRIKDMSEGYSWDRLTKLVKKAIGIF